MRRIIVCTFLMALIWAPAGHSAVNRPHSGQVIGRIIIPAIGVNLPVEQDNGAIEPGYYPVHYASTYFPGRGRMVAIAAHHQTHGQPFLRLGELERGSAIFIKMNTRFGGGAYRYRVTGKRRIVCTGSIKKCTSASKGFGNTALDKLVLTTCDERGLFRWFVYAYHDVGRRFTSSSRD